MLGEPPLPTSLQGRTVLLVEDEFLILLDLQFLLENEGASVATATSVAEGLQVADGTFDAAVLDVRLPDGEVFPVARKLTECHVPIVFHSGHARTAELTKEWPSSLALEKPARERMLIEAGAQQAALGELT